MCGADHYDVPLEPDFGGSSPRVRSRPHTGELEDYTDGIISACAEQTR